MTRFTSPLIALLLVLSLLLSAGSSGFLRAAHAVARAGQQTLVICSETGAETITLDRDGNPVSPATPCAHCADCTVPAAVLFAAVPTTARPAAQSRRLSPPLVRRLNAIPVDPSRARGPPATKGI